MLFLAEEAAKEVSRFNVFDLFIIAVTLVILIGLARLVLQPRKNKFAIGFAGVSLLVFLFLDFIMVKNWMGLL